MPSRSLWQGSISFGLANIPVKLYSATNSREYVFNQLCKNGHRIRYKKWCPEEESDIERPAAVAIRKIAQLYSNGDIDEIVIATQQIATQIAEGNNI
jgi:DNA end-binding protein Ku